MINDWQNMSDYRPRKKRQKTTQKAAQEEEMHFYFSHISESQKRESSTGKKNFYG